MDGNVHIDMHTHTSASDGFGTPEDLLHAAELKGLYAVAVTDHDVLDAAKYCYGYMRHRSERMGGRGIIMVPGVELSAWIDAEEEGAEVRIVHILGLGIDPYDCDLENLCGQLRKAHRKEAKRRLDHARKLGFGLDPEAEGRVLARGFWGKAEIARELVNSGRFECVHDAYSVLWNGSRTPINLDQYVHAGTAISSIHKSGGIAVLAHPLRDETTRGLVSIVEVEARIRLLACLGLDAVECFYSAFSLEQCERLMMVTHEVSRELCGRSLAVSAGSDHHDYARRNRLGKTCLEGQNCGPRTNILDALGLA